MMQTQQQSCESVRPRRAGDIASPVLRASRALLFRALERIREGRLTIADGASRHEFGGPARGGALQATVHVHDPAFYRAVTLGGSVGAGESFMAGHWSTDDLTALVRILSRNRDALSGMNGGFARLGRSLLRLHGLATRNTRKGSRRNIAAHYDLGNDFFRLFLDETMTYSSGMFPRPGMSMAEASIEKIDAACRKLDLKVGDHLLEIGTGWGALAIHAASNYGCRVTTTTLSKEQAAWARARIAEAGLSDRINVILEDYRDLRGTYDKLVSIEMIEAVGHEHFDTYFRRISDLLKPGGTALIQAITIQDQRYEKAKCEVDFIKRYIFPGGCLPSVTAICDSVRRASDMRLIRFEDFGADYAATLRIWREFFLRNADAIRGLGYPEPFMRMWEYYLCYCEGGFREGAIGVGQFLLAGPGHVPAGYEPRTEAAPPISTQRTV